MWPICSAGRSTSTLRRGGRGGWSTRGIAGWVSRWCNFDNHLITHGTYKSNRKNTNIIQPTSPTASLRPWRRRRRRRPGGSASCSTWSGSHPPATTTTIRSVSQRKTTRKWSSSRSYTQFKGIVILGYGSRLTSLSVAFSAHTYDSYLSTYTGRWMQYRWKSILTATRKSLWALEDILRFLRYFMLYIKLCIKDCCKKDIRH